MGGSERSYGSRVPGGHVVCSQDNTASARLIANDNVVIKNSADDILVFPGTVEA